MALCRRRRPPASQLERAIRLPRTGRLLLYRGYHTYPTNCLLQGNELSMTEVLLLGASERWLLRFFVPALHGVAARKARLSCSHEKVERFFHFLG
jgi:hypothetical protein